MTDDTDDGAEDLAARLRARRPTLGVGRRHQMRTHLLRLPQFSPRPAHLWLLVAALALSGLVLFALAAPQV